MRSRDSFNKAAELYDEVRPTYPKEAINWIIDNTKIGKEDRLLEIAPGTGQATMRFGERGFNIHAVELGDKLANILRNNTKEMNVEVDVSPFEEWVPNYYEYKMVYCATAFHWLDPETKYKKCYQLLEDEGYLVLMWNNAIGTKNKTINQAYDLLFSYYSEKPFSTKPKGNQEQISQFENGKNDINCSGYFEVDDYLERKWESVQSKEKTIKGFYTQSSYLSLDDVTKKELTNKLEILFQGLDDMISTEFLTTVYLCKKK